MNKNINKVAFVTGGGSGIGKIIAKKFAQDGYDVALSYAGSYDGACEVKKYAENLGRKCEVYKADLGKYSEIISLFEKFENDFGRIDVLVNNAGITDKSPFLETTEEIFDSICNVDFKGSYFCTQQTAKIMRKNGIEGSIIVISSNNASKHFANVSVYGAVKAAEEKFAEHAAIELAKYKIRVNIIAPGWTDTGAKRLGNKEDSFYKIPLQKWAEPSEIADAVIYLSSDSAKSITGSKLTIDNGASLVADKREFYGF